MLYLSDFVKTWPLGFCPAPGVARLQASAASKKARGLASWSVQLGGSGLGGGGGGGGGAGGGGGRKTSGVERGLFRHSPFSKQQCSQEALTGKYLVLTLP